MTRETRERIGTNQGSVRYESPASNMLITWTRFNFAPCTTTCSCNAYQFSKKTRSSAKALGVSSADRTQRTLLLTSLRGG